MQLGSYNRTTDEFTPQAKTSRKDSLLQKHFPMRKYNLNMQIFILRLHSLKRLNKISFALNEKTISIKLLYFRWCWKWENFRWPGNDAVPGRVSLQSHCWCQDLGYQTEREFSWVDKYFNLASLFKSQPHFYDDTWLFFFLLTTVIMSESVLCSYSVDSILNIPQAGLLARYRPPLKCFCPVFIFNTF